MPAEPETTSNASATPRASGLAITWWLVAGLLVAGIVIGRALAPGGPVPVSAADPAAATATRTAELAELEELRTRVAQPVVCTPAPEPTVTPTPTIAPPVAAGVELEHGGDWRVTVTNVQLVRAPGGVEVQGHLVLVSVRIVNLSQHRAVPPFLEWRLTAGDGAVGRVNMDAASEIAGKLWLIAFAGGQTDDRQLVFDVPGAPGGPYLLESEGDPGFRVRLEVEQRA